MVTKQIAFLESMILAEDYRFKLFKTIPFYLQFKSGNQDALRAAALFGMINKPVIKWPYLLFNGIGFLGVSTNNSWLTSKLIAIRDSLVKSKLGFSIYLTELDETFSTTEKLSELRKKADFKLRNTQQIDKPIGDGDNLLKIYYFCREGDCFYSNEVFARARISCDSKDLLEIFDWDDQDHVQTPLTVKFELEQEEGEERPYQIKILETLNN